MRGGTAGCFLKGLLPADRKRERETKTETRVIGGSSKRSGRTDRVAQSAHHQDSESRNPEAPSVQHPALTAGDIIYTRRDFWGVFERGSLESSDFEESGFLFAEMRRYAAVLLVLVVALYFLSAEAYKCRCTRKGPKIRYKDVQKLEIKPKHPFCQEKMIFVTMENVARFKGQEYCLHPKLQSTKNLVKWFRIWKDKHRVYEA
ncbi:C-X-C motif chemokine 14 [Echeneis naucrates]|uniref:Chemokine interleukin-8-like domain-containing protein n=1 Tax=Echeneis naucrates TaxID=173247 RepID=A0A665VPQ4_ECHNA|nr:C-X-C motif chemokine 14 [Echeneis naucrates]